MSRPWKVADTGSSRCGERVMSAAISTPSHSLPGEAEQPVVRADQDAAVAVRSAIARRSVPTCGSTTATWTPTGMYGSVFRNTSAPCLTAYRSIPCVMSTISASGWMPRITPWQTPTKSSSRP